MARARELIAIEAENFGRQQNVVENGAPRQQHGLLKDDTHVARGVQAAACRRKKACPGWAGSERR